jgi:predicted 3-demethylubiquinone-9 3-methyltransferase (glyoxalase superfamily)
MLEKERKLEMTPSFLFVKKLFGKGDEAINFYTSIFPNSNIGMIHRDPEKNTVMYSDFTLAGKRFALMEEGSAEHNFTITPAISFAVICKNQKEVDFYWEKLIEGGGKPVQCGWLEDKLDIAKLKDAYENG